MNKILFVLLSLLISLQSYSQEQNEKDVSFLLLGDIHYDLLEDHDMEWLSTKPDDLRQVTKEYSVFTKNTWPEFSRIISGQVQKHQPPFISSLCSNQDWFQSLPFNLADWIYLFVGE